MKSLFNWFATFLKANNQSWLGQVLTGAGLGLITIAALQKFSSYYKDQALSAFGELGAVTGLLGLAGVDKAISIVIGAYLAGVYIKTYASSLKVIKK